MCGVCGNALSTPATQDVLPELEPTRTQSDVAVAVPTLSDLEPTRATVGAVPVAAAPDLEPTRVAVGAVTVAPLEDLIDNDGAAPQAPVAVLQEIDVERCQTCGALSEGERFCSHCGQRFGTARPGFTEGPALRLCVACGVPNPPGRLKCMACGEVL